MKRLLRAVALAVATAAGAVPAFAADAAALLHDRLKLAPVLAGEFEQTKTLKGFRNPLVSHGEFLVARGQGVWWHTLKPFESTLVVTKTRLFTRNADGSTSELADAQAEPGVAQVNALIFSLLAVDPATLADKFDVVAQAVGKDGWTLQLTPLDPSLARFVAHATLAGERDVQTVRLDEARGDTTQIRFSHQQPAAALSADEAARLR